MTVTIDRAATARNENLTFKSNQGVGRHGWLRLTPAYGVRLVRDRISHMPAGSVITDPFSGTGTTPLAAAELGHFGQSVDVNPFLIWLGTAKVRHYSAENLRLTRDAVADVVTCASQIDRDALMWQPNLHNIERWWSDGDLHALKALRTSIDQHGGEVRDLLEIALCRTLIARSNAAFNHQSMSFKAEETGERLFDLDHVVGALSFFKTEALAIIESARYDLLGSATIHHGDSTAGVESLVPADLVLTSPPYVNRMSYIRELRPYMYWLRFLDSGQDAGELDWKAIGGTWGTATSKLNSWETTVETPVDESLKSTCAKIAADGGKNGPVLSTYVHKYFVDMWHHFQAITPGVKHGGAVSYIIGNSTFYGHEVPAQAWYAAMLEELGYANVRAELIRKRNSNKALFEYDVTGVRR